MSRANKIQDDDFEAHMAAFSRGTGSVKVTRVSRKEAVSENVPREDLYSNKLEIPLANSIRIANFKLMLPSTQKFIEAIYGSYNIYLSYSDPDKDPYRRLFDACMLHSRCFVDSICAVRGLQLLNIPVDEPTNVCHLGGCKLVSEDPVQKFHLVMQSICNDPDVIAFYKENLL